MSDITINELFTNFPMNPQTLKPEVNQNELRSIIREFSLNTSTHGLPGIARSQSIYNRLFWTVSFLVFTGIMLYFVTQSISAYYQYSTQTTIDVFNDWPQPFPAVTICNYSPLRNDRFIGPYLNYINEYNLTDNSTFSSVTTEHILTFLQYKLNRNEPLDDFYYSLDSMLIKCVYNGANCSANDFIDFLSPVYGRCYTFNAQSNDTNSGNLHFNNENGDSGKLELSLYAHSHQYVPFYADGTGIVVMVHNNTQLPLVDRVGIQLVPGRKHKLGYTKNTNLFLSSPYTTCNDKVTLGMQALYDQFSSGSYTYNEEICFKVAIQTYTYQECGCVNPFEWAARYVVVFGTNTIIRAPLCNLSDSCYSDAAEKIRSSSSLLSIYAADCGLECSSVGFELRLSSILSPPEWLMYNIKTFVESSSIPLSSNWSTTWQAEIQTNYIAMDVVCESTRVTRFTQQATLSGVDVLSNVGGQTGLWIGISFLSFMEFIEMLYRVIRHQYYRIREKTSRKRTSEQAIDTQSIASQK